MNKKKDPDRHQDDADSHTTLSQINIDLVLDFLNTHLQQHLRAGQAVAVVQEAAARQRSLTQP